jgi:hypothetical protein
MMAEQDSQGFFARIAQAFSMFLGRQQQERQQFTQEAERLQSDGFTRGNDDPDNRRQQNEIQGRFQISQAEALDIRSMLFRARVRENEQGHMPEMDSGYRPVHADPHRFAREQLERQVDHVLERKAGQAQRQQEQGDLLAPHALQAIRERLQAHHRALQQQQRGQGRGY